VPEVGFEPAPSYEERIVRTLKTASPGLTKRYEPVFTGLAVVKVSLGLVKYQHVRQKETGLAFFLLFLTWIPRRCEAESDGHFHQVG
jgi:hypothetical protein